MKAAQVIARIILSFVLIVKVYEETGIYVGLFAVLTLVAIEGMVLICAMQRQINENFYKRIRELEQ